MIIIVAAGTYLRAPLSASGSSLEDPTSEVVCFDADGEKAWELSGVAERDGVLFMVDDKTNTIVIYDARTKKKEGSLSPKEFGKTLKFEDIAYHRRSDTFFVTGAQYKFVTKEGETVDFQKIIRFTLKKGNEWKVSNVNEVVLSEGVQVHKPGPPDTRVSAEGLALVDDGPGTTILWIGIRSEHVEGKFRVLEYRSNNTSKNINLFSFTCQHDFAVCPSRTRGGGRLHLSGLFALTDGSLIVLGTTEDRNNEYLGNVLYRVDTRKWSKSLPGPEFTHDQKAEGIVVWDNYVGIVYDNDQKTVSELGRPGRSSSLQIFPSILPLGP